MKENIKYIYLIYVSPFSQIAKEKQVFSQLSKGEKIMIMPVRRENVNFTVTLIAPHSQ